MAVPTLRTDLSATAGSNSPAGSDTISTGAGIDEYFRAHAAFIRQNYDDILLKATYASPTFTGTVVLPAATSVGSVTATEITYLSGVTAPIQTQIDNLILGSGTFQPLDADLTAIAGLTPTDSNIIVGNGSTWVAESGATARASLGVRIGTDVQAYSSYLIKNLEMVSQIGPMGQFSKTLANAIQIGSQLPIPIEAILADDLEVRFLAELDFIGFAQKHELLLPGYRIRRTGENP